MNLVRVAISAYGHFSDQEVDFAEGLNVVYGPNESGKTTLLNFLVDMLYGQKKLDDNKQMAPSHKYYAPENDGNYGGELVYRLSDNNEFHIFRNFNKPKSSLISLMDLGLGKEAMTDYPVAKNNESLFLAEQTGMTKEMFLACALIGHDAVHEFHDPINDNDQKGLSQLRRKIASTVDSAGLRSAAEAHEVLSQFRFGDLKGPRGGGAIPKLSDEIEALEATADGYAKTREQAETCRLTAKTGREKLTSLSIQLEKLEHARDSLEFAQVTHLLKEVERITLRMSEIDTKLFENERAHYFSEGDFDELRSRQGMRGSLSEELALKNKRFEDALGKHKLIADELENGKTILSIDVKVVNKVDEDIATIKALEREINEPTERIESLDNKLRALQGEFDEVSRESLPPEEILDNQKRTEAAGLVTEIASARDEIAHLKGESADREAELARAREIIADTPKSLQSWPGVDIEAKLNAFEQARHTAEMQKNTRSYELGRLTKESFAKNTQITIASSAALVLMVVGVVLFTFATSHKGGTALMMGMIGAVCLVAAALLYTKYISRTKNYQADRNMEAETVRTKIILARETAETAYAEISEWIDDYDANVLGILEKIRTVRDARDTVKRLEKRLKPTLNRIADRQEHMDESRKALAAILNELGVELGDDDERESFNLYSQKFDECRNNIDCHSQLRAQIEQHSKDLAETRERIEERRKENNTTTAQLQRLLRSVGFEAKYLEAEGKELIEKWHRYDKMHETLKAAERDLKQATEDVESSKQKLEDTDRRIREILSKSGALSVEDFTKLRQEHKDLVKLGHEKNRLEDQRRHILTNMNETQLRRKRDGLAARVKGQAPEPDKKALDAVMEEIEGARDNIQRIREEVSGAEAAYKQASRDLPDEVELAEEIALLRSRLKRLEDALEAVVTAMNVLNKVSESTHREFSPALAERASQLLAKITKNRYSLVHVGPDLELRIEGGSLNVTDTDRLSRGTADQVFLAVRLALSELFNKTGEPIPVLIDDPFVNYDENRRKSAIKMLSRAAPDRQIIIFTCNPILKNELQTIGASVQRLTR